MKTPLSFRRMFARHVFLHVFAFIGVLLTLILVAGGMIFWHKVNKPAPQPKVPENIVLDLDFTRPISEQGPKFNLSLHALLKEEDETPLLVFTRALARAAKDPRVKGVVGKFGSLQPSLVHVQEIMAQVKVFRDAGKFSYAFGTEYGGFGGGNKTYLLASSFEKLWLQPVGSVGLASLGIEAPFGKTALANLGVTTDFMRREEYKSVMEEFARDSFSQPVRANMEAMLKSLSGQYVQGISQNLKWDPAKVETLIAKGPYTTNEAKAEGLVAEIGYEDEVVKAADDKAGAGVKHLAPETYLSLTAPKDKPKATIALIRGIGEISDTPERGAKRLTDDDYINSDELAGAFDAATKDSSIKAILFRIDSPGGSPSASETIRHALDKAREAKKPVFVSMGAVAASGGYWIAMDADKIIADPGTLTGSIGVVAGKFVLGGLFEKLGVKWDTIALGENAKFFSPLAPFPPSAQAKMNVMLDETYAAFTQQVGKSRKLSPEKVAEIAKGRVFTGEQAAKLGLVDELGGIDTAVLALKKELGLAPEDLLGFKSFPAPETPASLVFKILKNIGLQSLLMGQALSATHEAASVMSPLIDEWSSAGQISARLPLAVRMSVGK